MSTALIKVTYSAPWNHILGSSSHATAGKDLLPKHILVRHNVLWVLKTPSGHKNRVSGLSTPICN